MATPKSGKVPSARPSATKTIVITGAGRGLGLALARSCVARGDRIIATLRERGRDEGLLALADSAPERVQVLSLDVGDERSCAELGRQVAARADRVDLLINNAGINSSSAELAGRERAADLERLEADALVAMLRTNALGAVFVTRALRPLLAAGEGRVINVTSRRGSLASKRNGGNYGYCMSKAALNMATRALAEDLAPEGITVVCVHPGEVRTAMAQPDASLSPEEAARALLDLADTLTPSHGGRFLTTRGEDHPW